VSDEEKLFEELSVPVTVLSHGEVRRLILATAAGCDPATKGVVAAVFEWAKEIRTNNEVLRRVLDGALVVTGMSADGPVLALVVDWPEEQQQAYREALRKSDAIGAH